MRRYCLALDLKSDSTLMQRYIEHHRNVWPEVQASIRNAGIRNMQIYRRDDRLFMIMEVDDTFSFEHKAAIDRNDARVQEWEALMGSFQKPLSSAAPDEKWVLMDCIFDLQGAPEVEAVV
jgi:L-rhamnose mutarotase